MILCSQIRYNFLKTNTIVSSLQCNSTMVLFYKKYLVIPDRFLIFESNYAFKLNNFVKELSKIF